jgi:hypothetical protein
MSKLGILDNNPVFVHAIEFEDQDIITLAYQEKREISENIMIARTMRILIDTPEKEEIFMRLQEQAIYLIDEASVELRNSAYDEG